MSEGAPATATEWLALAEQARQQGQAEQAIQAFYQALALEPDSVLAWNNLGNTLRSVQRAEEAVQAFACASQLRPDLGVVWLNLASAQLELANFPAAEEAAMQALARQPSAGGWYMLGSTFRLSHRYAEAEYAYGQALSLDPQHAASLGQLGLTYKAQGRYQAARDTLLAALALQPADGLLWNNYANLLQDLTAYDEAAEAYQRALQLAPDQWSTWSNFLLAQNARPELSTEMLVAWHRQFGVLLESRIAPVTLAERAAWCGLDEKLLAAHTKNGLYGPLNKDSFKIKIGFLSADFRAHPIGYFLESVLAAFDRTRFELIAYANQAGQDAVTERLHPLFDQWRWVRGMADEMLVRQIVTDRIDVLMDLSGHSADNRLPVFARRPAPVQISYLGYFNTTGLSRMDYLLGNALVTPAEDAGEYTERLLHLPGSYVCFTPPQLSPAEVDFLLEQGYAVADGVLLPGELPALRNGYVTFGCCNNLAKMNEAVVASWAGILHRVAESRLLLKSRALGDEAVQQQVAARFAGHGIAAERLILRGESSYAEYLATYQEIDVALDPFPYGGTTISVEALWMGVPVLSVRGGRYAARMTENLLHYLPLPEFLAASVEALPDLAQAQVADVAALASLRRCLRQQLLDSPLCDAAGFVAGLQDVLESTHQAALMGEKRR